MPKKAGDLSALRRIEHSIRKEDLKAIPPSGPAIVVANHPFGGIDGLLLASVLGGVRRDVRILANYFLGALTDMRPLFILADPFGRQSSVSANKKALKECIQWVSSGGILAIFPAGEVSQLHLRRRKIEDPDWAPAVSRLVPITEVPVMPVYFDTPEIHPRRSKYEQPIIPVIELYLVRSVSPMATALNPAN